MPQPTHIDHILTVYFRTKQFSMGQRFMRTKVISSLAGHGISEVAAEEGLKHWEQQGLLTRHPNRTVSLTASAYPLLTR